MKLRFLKSQKGQTSIEYLLLIVVAVSFGLVFAKKMDQYLIKNPNGLIGAPLKGFKEKLSQDPTNRYRVYPIGPMAK
jgi:Flp pilus assembly pilin Flp